MAEIQRFTAEKVTKETLRALAMGMEVEKKMLKPAGRGLKDVLGFYLSLEAPKMLRKVDGGFKKAGVVFHKSKFSSV